jgi:hypothetical protein
VCTKFDEASDVQMHDKLNVFVISCLYTGEEKTLTLALHGLDVFTFNVEFHNAVVVLYTFPILIVTIELPDGSARLKHYTGN